VNKQASFRFYAELNDFLPASKREKALACDFKGRQSVKHLIESLGVPHTEVSRIYVDGREIHSEYLVQDGDQVDVYPPTDDECARQFSASAGFVLDNHLGQLCGYLRMLGFDALYRNDYQDETLAEISARENRILLTRDRRLLMRNRVRWGYWVRSKEPRVQIKEVVQRYNLYAGITPFRRCMRCNAVLQNIRKEAVIDRLEPLTKKYFHDFRICPQCEQIYWKGSHYDRMQGFISELLGERERG